MISIVSTLVFVPVLPFQAINDTIVGMAITKRTMKKPKNSRGLTLYKESIFLQSESLGLLAK